LFKALKDIRDTLGSTLALSGNISANGNVTAGGDLILNNAGASLYLKTASDATSRVLYLQNLDAVGTLGLDIEGDLNAGGTISGDGSGLTALSASNVSSGTLSADRYSAYDDLTAETKIGASAGQLMPGDTDNWVNVSGDTMTGTLNFANGTAYYVDASGNAKFNASESAGNATVGGTLAVNDTGTSSVAGSLNVGGGYGSSGVTLTSDGNVQLNGNLQLDGNIIQSTGTVYYSDALHYTGDYSVSGTMQIGYDPQIADNTNYLAVTAGGQIRHDQDLIMQVDFNDTSANRYFRVRNGSGTDTLTLDESGNLNILGSLTGSGTLGTAASRWSAIYGAAGDLSGNLTVSGTGSFSSANFTLDSSGNISKLGGGSLTSGVADGASAVGFTLATPAYSASGAKLFSVENGAVEKLSLDKDGLLAVGNDLKIAGTNFTLDYDNVDAGADQAITFERGSSGTDATIQWDESNDRFNLTVGGLNIPSGQNYLINGSQMTLDNIAEGAANLHLTSALKSNYDAAYGWGSHAAAGYFVKASDTLDNITAGTSNIHFTAALKSNYDSAYSNSHARGHAMASTADHTDWPAGLDVTELGYVNGVTSAIQTQLDSKMTAITGAATTIVSNDLTANKALISTAGGKVAVSTTTNTELGYLSGVTSAIQTQFSSKASAASPTFTGTVTIPTPFTIGAVSMTATGTQLNYLNAATGTTGTASTNLVFSTSPTLVTPILGAASATSLDITGGNLDLNGYDIENINKLTVTTIDPVYNINGRKYSTYVSDMVGGVKTEIFGKIEVKTPVAGGSYREALNLTQQPDGSDLWLFEKTADLGAKMENLVVILTPENSQKASAWYELNAENSQLVIYADRPGSVSYRLSAPRLDYREWSNSNYEEGVKGIDVAKYGK